MSDPKARPAHPPDIVGRFWAKVQKNAENECWPWLAAKFENGYGAFSIGGRLLKAHRVAYELTFGAPRDKVLHSCDNRPCCSPGHLRDGSHAENMAERGAKSRQCRGARSPNAKLDDAAIREIRADGRGARVVANERGIARSLVQRIRQRRQWAHVD